MENIQIIKTNGTFQKHVEEGKSVICYQSLETIVDNFELFLEENSKWSKVYKGLKEIKDFLKI